MPRIARALGRDRHRLAPAVPPILAALGDRLVVNDDVFDWDDLPRSVAVFGPGVIGLELGQALARLGVRVVVLGAAAASARSPIRRCAPTRPPGLRRGVRARPGRARARSRARRRRGRDSTTAATDGGERVERFDYVLAATGRTPNVDRLGLEHTRARAATPAACRCSTGTRCSAARATDLHRGRRDNDMPLLHEAADEGSIAGENAARFPARAPGARRAPLGVVFTDPQIAIVGGGFAELPAGRTRRRARCPSRTRAARA